MREEIPAPGAVAVVIQPGPEDEVGCDAEEDSVESILASKREKDDNGTKGGDGRGEGGGGGERAATRTKTYIKTSQVKNPQPPFFPVPSPPSSSSSTSSQAYFVRQFNVRTSMFCLPSTGP